MLNRTLASTALVILGMVGTGVASAQTRTWSFLDNTNPGACSGTAAVGGALSTAAGNTWNCTDQGSNAPPFNLALSAFSAANGKANTSLATGNTNVGGTGTNNFAAATVILHGGQTPVPAADGYGVGVGNSTEGGSAATSGSGNHAMDSNDGSTDMLLLNFTSAQVLRSVVLGWAGGAGGDADFQVLACVACSVANGTGIAGKNAAGLLAAGWSLVTTYDVSVPGNSANYNYNPDQSFSVNSNGVSSSYWLITAYNSSFGGSVAGSNGDAMKIMGVTSRPSGVPEPGSLALAGLALLGILAGRKAQRLA